jgi:D-inositol-3-phosphate glycosyltransferase
MSELVVSIIEPVGGHGGMNYYDFGLARGLDEAGCAVKLYTCDETAHPTTGKFGFATPFRKIYGSSHKLFRSVRFFIGTIRSLVDSRRRRALVVHLHFFHAGMLESLLVGLVRAFGFKLVITVHDVESFAGDGGSASARRIFSRADLLIAHNEVSVRELTDKLKIAHEKIRKIPHGNYVDFMALSERSQARKFLGLSENLEIVLFFGQIKAVKGLDLLLRAIAALKQSRPNLRLLIAGKVWKDSFDKYQNMIEELGLSDVVIAHVRYIPDEDVGKYYGAADIVALPYRKIYQSGVLLMAMSFRKIVVASDLLGMTEVIADGVNGHIFVSNDVASLQQKIDDGLSSIGRDEMSKSAHDLMVDKYSWKKIGVDTMRAYRSIV